VTADIFLSYNREDQATARRFAEAFEAQGFSVWWDVTLRSGESYDEVTEEALRSAKAVVVLWSKKSVASRWVRAEATVAARNRTLVPVRIEPCDLPVMFELTQTADLGHWRGEAGDKVWRAFLADVQRTTGRPGELPERGTPQQIPQQTPAMAGDAAAFVALLPLSCRTGDAEMEHLADELTGELTRELAQHSFFGMIAAGTMAVWRGRPADYRAIGREQGARYVLEGRLQRHGEQVRLTVQLIDTATGGVLTSMRYSRELVDVDAAPEEFALEAGSQLGETIVQAEIDRAMNKPGPYSAWEHVMRATGFLSRISSDSLRIAIEEARQAIAAAPDLGLAHALLAQSLALPVAAAGEELGDTRRKEIQLHARRAMQLDGNNPAVIERLTTANAVLDDRDLNFRLAQRLAELRPHSPLSLFRLGSAYLALGRSAEGLAALTEYDHLSRFDNHRPLALFCLGCCHFLEGQPVEAEAALDRALALYPDFNLALVWKGIVAASQGEEQRAMAAMRRYREAEADKPIDHMLRPISRLRHERLPEVLALLRRLWEATESDA